MDPPSDRIQEAADPLRGVEPEDGVGLRSAGVGDGRFDEPRVGVGPQPPSAGEEGRPVPGVAGAGAVDRDPDRPALGPVVEDGRSSGQGRPSTGNRRPGSIAPSEPSSSSRKRVSANRSRSRSRSGSTCPARRAPGGRPSGRFEERRRASGPPAGRGIVRVESRTGSSRRTIDPARRLRGHRRRSRRRHCPPCSGSSRQRKGMPNRAATKAKRPRTFRRFTSSPRPVLATAPPPPVVSIGGNSHHWSTSASARRGSGTRGRRRGSCR